MSLPFHPITTIFPLIEGQEFKDLVIDIGLHGLRNSIWTWKGEIIDGRNRARACKIAKVEPRYQEWDGNGSLVAFVLSLNLHRRQLNASERGMLAARAAALMEEEARQQRLANLKQGSAPTGSKEPIGENKAETGRSAEKAAKLAKVSESTVKRAKKVIEEGTPELIEAVDSGKVKVSTAAGWTGLSPEQIVENIKAESEKAGRVILEADAKDVAEWLAKTCEKILRRIDHCGFGFHKSRKLAEKLKDAVGEDLIYVLENPVGEV